MTVQALLGRTWRELKSLGQAAVEAVRRWVLHAARYVVSMQNHGYFNDSCLGAGCSALRKRHCLITGSK